MAIFGIAPGRLALALAALFGALAFTLASSACDFAGSVGRNFSRAAPNILVILVDDLGYNDVGFNGATQISTPNIDRLAREGVVFPNGYVPYPSCGPSRAAIMTGRYPSRFGMELNLAYAPSDEEHGLPVEETTMADYLKRAGYRTGVVGKWQLGAAPPFHPLNRGFDEFFGFLGGGHNYFKIDITESPLSEYLLPLNEGRGATGFDGYLTDVLTDEAIEFVEGGGEPFFLYLAYNAPHSPLEAPASLVRQYSDVENEKRRRYLAMIHSLDDNVGRLMSALEESGRRDDTLIFFLSDNGGVTASDLAPNEDWSDNAPFSGGKGFFAEGGVRVPFIASWTGAWASGETYSPMVVSMDIMATALGVAGVEAAERPLDGVNLDPFLRGEADGAPRDALFWRQWQFREGDRFAARAGDLKLIRDIGQNTTARLYDLAADPAETRDLMAERPEDALRIAEMWNEWNAGNVNGAYPWRSRYYERRDAAAAGLAADFRARAESKPPYRISDGMMLAASMGDAASCWSGVAVSDPSANPELAEDCEALMASKTALGGGGLNWSYAVPMEEWDGLTLGGSPLRAQRLSLTERELDGAIPPQLGALDGLRELALNRNRLSGRLPPELGALTNLRTLVLATNRLSGELPPELGALTNLSELWLRDNLLTGEIPAELGELENLTLIRLAANQFEGCVPAALGDMESEDYALAGLAVCGR